MLGLKESKVSSYVLSDFKYEKKGKVGNDEDIAQSERNSYTKTKTVVGKKLNTQSGIYIKKTYSKPNGQLFSQ